MTAPSLAELSRVLCRERELLDALVRRLNEGVDAGDCTDLVHSVSCLELHRAITAREAALELGLTGDPSLQDLVEGASDGWSDVLAEHRRALLLLMGAVRVLAGVPVVDVRGAGTFTESPAQARDGVQRSLRDFLS